MRGKVNYGISGNYVINGVRRDSVVDDASISKGDFVNAHYEPDSYKYLTAKTAVYNYPNIKVLGDGNILIFDSGMWLYDVSANTCTRISSISEYSDYNMYTLTRFNDDPNAFLYFSHVGDYDSDNKNYPVKEYAYILRYDPDTKEFTNWRIFEYKYPLNTFSDRPRGINENDEVFVNGNQVLLVCHYGSAAASGWYTRVRSFLLTGAGYDDYSLQFVKDSGFSTNWPSSSGSSPKYTHIANGNYVLIAETSDIQTSSMSSIGIGYVYNYGAEPVKYPLNFDALREGAGGYGVPVEITDTKVYLVVADKDLNLYYGYVNISDGSGSKSSLNMKLSANESYMITLIWAKTFSDKGSILTIKDSSGNMKRAFFGYGGHGSFKNVITAAYRVNSAVDYQGEYQDNFFYYEKGAAVSSDPTQTIIRSQKIINKEIVDTSPGVFYVLNAKDSRHINGVANESGKKGDTIQCILSEYVGAED